MKSFEMSGTTLEGFVQRVREALAGRELGEMVSLEQEADGLVVRFERMGTSELHYRVTPQDGGFHAELEREDIAPLHGMFRATFEEKLAQVLGRLGARVD